MQILERETLDQPNTGGTTLTDAEELQRLRDFFDNAAIGLHWVGADGTILRANRADYELLGYTADEYIGQNITKFHVDEDAIDDILSRLSRGETLHDYPARLRCKDGSIRHVLIDSSVYFRGDEFVNTRCLTRDVTAQAAGEEQRRWVEDRLTLLVEASGHLINSLERNEMLPATLSLSTRLLDADAYALWALDDEQQEWRAVVVEGLSPEYLAQSATVPAPTPVPTAPDRIIAEDVESEPILAERLAGFRREGIKSLLVLALQVEGVNSGTLTFYYKRPHRFSELELRVATALANLAASATALARSRDRERESLARVERSNQKLAFLARASATLASSLDYEATLQRVAQMAVPEIADWCVVNVVDAAGEPHTVAVAHSDPAKVSLARELQERYPVDMDAPTGWPAAMRKGKPELIEAITDELLEASGLDEERIAIVRDLGLRSSLTVPLVARDEKLGAITLVTAEQHAPLTPEDVPFAEELARRAAIAIDNAQLFREVETVAQDLLEANSAKDEFLSMVSHELKTPITTIMGNSEILLRRAERLDAEARAMSLQDINISANRLAELIDNLLLLSRLEVGKKLELEPILVRHEIDRVVSEFQRRDPGRRITVLLEPAITPVSGDAVYFRQVLQNLLSNAMKYSPGGSPIEVRTERRGGELAVSVIDHGQGLSAQDQALVFEPFYRSPAVSPFAPGAGVGLAVCKRLVEAQGGTIGVDATDGGGCTFTFTLRVDDVP